MENRNESNISINTKILGNQYNNHIYNKKEGKRPFLLQFKQLKYYYNLRKQFKNNVSLGYIPQGHDEIYLPKITVAQNMYCLIDRKWLNKWKNHVGYKIIKKKIKEDKIERDLDNNDYKWISEIIDKNYKDNYLNPLDNNTIYKDNEINPFADFKVIHKDCFELFNIIYNNLDINKNFRRYTLRLFKDKYFVYLNNDMLYIVFRNINSKKFTEIIVNFTNNEKSEEIEITNKKQIIDILSNKDINEYLKEINFNFYEIEKEIEYFNCKIKIYNKTFLRRVEEYFMSIFPNIRNERNELLNTNILSNGLMKIVEIDELKQRIKKLEEELDKEKNKNKMLEQNIINLKKELKKEKDKDLTKNININKLNQIIVEKENKIKTLEKKLSRFPFELNEREKLISVIFISLDQNLYYSIICKNTDRFDTIEKKLYDVYSQYSETENYFTVNGNKINKLKTLEDNKIKNNDLIILNQIK